MRQLMVKGKTRPLAEILAALGPETASAVARVLLLHTTPLGDTKLN